MVQQMLYGQTLTYKTLYDRKAPDFQLAEYRHYHKDLNIIIKANYKNTIWKQYAGSS